MKWTDASLCESGFSFDRNGNLFTPVYAVQAQQPCGLPHAPTSVFDDLATAEKSGEANIGTTQVYCIRAINPIGCTSGSYSSAPSCTSVVINWESAINGYVLGTVNTGNAPVSGVTITWSFVNFPAATGTGTTNGDGRFVENSSGNLGINIQASCCDS